MPELSQKTKHLISDYRFWYEAKRPGEEVPTVHVDEVASKVASFYEKIRGVIDYRGEHLLRKTAIERKLKRRLLLNRLQLNNGFSDEKSSAQTIAEPLVYELIQGGHFPNDAIEESKIKEIEKVLDKYIFILKNSPQPSNGKKSKAHFSNWILDIAACEIEDILSPPSKEEALINYMTDLMLERITVREEIRMAREEIETQTYIAVQQALFNLDSALITYNLLKKWYPNWLNLPREELRQITEKIHLIKEKTEKAFIHPFSEKFYKICERYDTPYLILNDIISENPMTAEERISQPENLESLIGKAYQKRVKTLKSKLSRAAIYSTISIFLTNILSLLAVEIPFTRYVTGQFNFLAVGVDILGPTFLMFFLVASIRPPEKKNLGQIILETVKIVYESERKPVYIIKPPKKKGFISRILIFILYLTSFCLSFGLIIYGLHKVNFPFLSYIIFVVFISLIAFTGVKIRGRAKELKVTAEKGTFSGFLLDLLSLPLLGMGKWLSIRWKKYNVMAVFFSALIDMPFQIFVEFFENLRAFLVEKKEEIH